MLRDTAAQKAVAKDPGARGDSKMLTGFEWRMCVKPHRVAEKLVSGDAVSAAEQYGSISR